MRFLFITNPSAPAKRIFGVHFNWLLSNFMQYLGHFLRWSVKHFNFFFFNLIEDCQLQIWHEMKYGQFKNVNWLALKSIKRHSIDRKFRKNDLFLIHFHVYILKNFRPLVSLTICLRIIGFVSISPSSVHRIQTTPMLNDVVSHRHCEAHKITHNQWTQNR